MAPGAVPGKPSDEGRLIEALDEARRLGFLGPGDPRAHLRHAEGLARMVEVAVGSAEGPAELCDLGSGGGVPGLAMLCRWQAARGALIESSRRRCEYLRDAVDALGLGGRAMILEGRAEDFARRPDLRERFEVVVARSFARPAVTSEIAAGLVAVSGFLVVSDPPGGPVEDRWPSDRLAELGFGPARLSRGDGATAAVMTKRSGVPERFPRRVGVPAKRPLW